MLRVGEIVKLCAGVAAALVSVARARMVRVTVQILDRELVQAFVVVVDKR